MGKATVHYGNNNLRYNEKTFLDSDLKLHREEICNATWRLQIGELVRLSQSRNYGSPTEKREI